MSPNEIQEDATLAALRELRTIDLSAARAERLRTRCHSTLMRQDSPGASKAGVSRPVVPVLAGVWCVLYLLETMRRAAAAYGF